MTITIVPNHWPQPHSTRLLSFNSSIRWNWESLSIPEIWVQGGRNPLTDFDIVDASGCSGSGGGGVLWTHARRHIVGARKSLPHPPHSPGRVKWRQSCWHIPSGRKRLSSGPRSPCEDESKWRARAQQSCQELQHWTFAFIFYKNLNCSLFLPVVTSRGSIEKLEEPIPATISIDNFPTHDSG